MSAAKIDYDHDITSLIQAAEGGDVVAQLELGGWYYHGDGGYIEQSDAKSVHWFRRAALQGSPDAQFLMGAFCEMAFGMKHDAKEAAKWYKKAAEQEHNPARYALGMCYKHGFGVIQDDDAAARYFRLAADEEDADAQYALGCCYQEGRGVLQDDTQALFWLKKSAELGFDEAYYSIGLHLLSQKDTESHDAKYYLQKAADLGHAKAAELLHQLSGEDCA